MDIKAREEIKSYMKEISVLEKAIEKHEEQISEYEDEVSEIEDMICTLLAKEYNVEEVELGSWGCPQSPTGHCFYDAVNDSINDFCLVCGEPDERK